MEEDLAPFMRKMIYDIKIGSFLWPLLKILHPLIWLGTIQLLELTNFV